MLKTVMAAATDSGRLRANNEDAYLVAPQSGLAAVADGMGGHAGGEVASAIAIAEVAQVHQALLRGERLDERLFLDSAIRAHAECERVAATSPSLVGLGCTLTAAYFAREEVVVAHTGDSRMYRLREKRLTPLTEDHTKIWHLVQRSVITREQARGRRGSNILTNCIGGGSFDLPYVDMLRLPVEKGDRFLICSDGLTDMLPETEIADLLAAPLDDVARGLVGAANDAGGSDNITVVVIDVVKA